MSEQRNIAVLDVGKTNVKLALVDLHSLTEVAVVTMPNVVREGPLWPHFDTEAHWAFFLKALAGFQRDHGVDGVSVATHGASIVLLDKQGALAAPILDYEHSGPDELAAEYDRLRPDFALTGSPKLAGGLSVGAQMHWQFQQDETLRDRVAHVLTYPQYWAYRLTGVLSSDITSIACHTDLWCPMQGQFSGLVDALGIRDRMAQVRKSSDVLGPILPDIVAATGVLAGTPVVCGIHDSNASLYPHLLSQSGAFSVVSTGTWVIVMTMGAGDVALDPTRDTLMNVNALGHPVPSARFMGGREFEMIQNGYPVTVHRDDIAQVLAQGLMILPSVYPLTGPFQGRTMRWIGEEPPEGSGLRAAALSFYLALMTDTCLHLTGANGATIVEGPFGRNPEFLEMLQAATGREVQRSHSETGTSIGAAMLFGTKARPKAPVAVPLTDQIAAYRAYAAQWRERVAALV